MQKIPGKFIFLDIVGVVKNDRKNNESERIPADLWAWSRQESRNGDN
jgi:hypothetical protein